jgi:hypothetical protein
MTRRWLLFAVIGLLFVVGLPRPSGARVVRFVVEQRRSFAGGTSFGNVGTYERLDGTAYMEVDPSDPLSAVVVNLDKAPRNARGMVEYTAPFFILKPVDMARGNHKIFYGVNNRGNKQTLGYFNFVPIGPGINDPITAADAGDGFLMRLGYTVVDADWEQGTSEHGPFDGGTRIEPGPESDNEPTMEGIGEVQLGISTARAGGLFPVRRRGPVWHLGRLWTAQCVVGQLCPIRGLYG